MRFQCAEHVHWVDKQKNVNRIHLKVATWKIKEEVEESDMVSSSMDLLKLK
jgi:hypothetical protein